MSRSIIAFVRTKLGKVQCRDNINAIDAEKSGAAVDWTGLPQSHVSFMLFLWVTFSLALQAKVNFTSEQSRVLVRLSLML